MLSRLAPLLKVNTEGTVKVRLGVLAELKGVNIRRDQPFLSLN